MLAYHQFQTLRVRDSAVQIGYHQGTLVWGWKGKLSAEYPSDCESLFEKGGLAGLRLSKRPFSN